MRRPKLTRILAAAAVAVPLGVPLGLALDGGAASAAAATVARGGPASPPSPAVSTDSGDLACIAIAEVNLGICLF